GARLAGARVSHARRESRVVARVAAVGLAAQRASFSGRAARDELPAELAFGVRLNPGACGYVVKLVRDSTVSLRGETNAGALDASEDRACDLPCDSRVDHHPGHGARPLWRAARSRHSGTEDRRHWSDRMGSVPTGYRSIWWIAPAFATERDQAVAESGPALRGS